MRTGQRMVLTHSKKLNNKGFSLIELIIVIVIIVVLATMTVMSLGIVKRANEERLTREIAQAIGETKIMTMASGQAVYMSITRDDEGVYINRWTNPKATGPSTELIKGSKNLTVTISGVDFNSGAAEKKITFNKVTGAVASNDITPLVCGSYSIKVYNNTGKVEWH